MAPIARSRAGTACASCEVQLISRELGRLRLASARRPVHQRRARRHSRRHKADSERGSIPRNQIRMAPLAPIRRSPDVPSPERALGGIEQRDTPTTKTPATTRTSQPGRHRPTGSEYDAAPSCKRSVTSRASVPSKASSSGSVAKGRPTSGLNAVETKQRKKH